MSNWALLKAGWLSHRIALVLQGKELRQDNLTFKEWEYVKEHGPCHDREYEVGPAESWLPVASCLERDVPSIRSARTIPEPVLLGMVCNKTKPHRAAWIFHCAGGRVFCTDIHSTICSETLCTDGQHN